jgi:hypothetical protein
MQDARRRYFTSRLRSILVWITVLPTSSLYNLKSNPLVRRYCPSSNIGTLFSRYKFASIRRSLAFERFATQFDIGIAREEHPDQRGVAGYRAQRPPKQLATPRTLLFGDSTNARPVLVGQEQRVDSDVQNILVVITASEFNGVQHSVYTKRIHDGLHPEGLLRIRVPITRRIPK